MKRLTIEPKNDAPDHLAPASSPLSLRQKTPYRALLETAPDAIVVVNQSGAIVLVNAQAEKLFGYRRGELIGQPATILVSENFRNQHSHEHSRFLATPQERPSMAGLELFGLRKDGTEFPIEIRLSPLDTKEGVLVSSAIRDISDRRRTEEDLRRLASIVACTDDAIVGKTTEGIITSWNAAAQRIYGYSASEAIGQPVTMLVPLDRADEVPRLLERLKRGETIDHYETVRVRKDGKEIPMEVTVSPIRDALERIVGASTIARDISVRKQRENDLSRLAALAEDRLRALSESQEQLQLLEEIATSSNKATSVQEAMKFTLDRVCAYTGWPIGHVYFAPQRNTEPMVSTNIWHLPNDDRFDQFREATEGMDFPPGTGLAGRVSVSREPAWITDVTDDANFPRGPWARQAGLRAAFAFPVISRNEVAAILEFFSETVSDPKVALIRIMSQIGNVLGRVVERVRAAETLLHDAFHDPLTALPNRALFLDRLERAIVRADRHSDYQFAVLFIDIDRFKIVNDSLGHPAGDDLLIQVSERILSCLRLQDVVSRPIPGSAWKAKDDTLARLGGDEFTILLDDIRDPSDSVRVAERIQNSFAEPFVIRNQDVFATASIGITANSGHAVAVDVLRDADTAMYRAKLLGGARCEVFDQAMHEHSVNRLNLETDLRRALERKEFRVFYQPIIALRTGNISGFEALVRWQRSDNKLVPPAAFIGVAEETGLIVAIGKWVLKTACEQAHQWHLASPREVPLTMSVNISARQFLQDDLVTQVEEILRETQVEPTAINLEVTENVAMGDAERTIRVVHELKKLGLRFSIDDFGTGYSSLSYLGRFPMDTLKIDRSFVSNLKSNPENHEIIRTIVGLARNLGMDVVAEGTETLEEITYLKTLDCEFAQGYFFSKPVDSAAAQALLREDRNFAHDQSTAPVTPIDV
jgi:PAS domain S-box-containing protein